MKKFLAVFLCLAIIMHTFPLFVFADEAVVNTIEYSKIIKADGWTSSGRIWQEWEPGSGKALGVANKIEYNAKPLQKAVQGQADPVSGMQNSVKFPLKSGNTDAFLIFASRSHSSGESASMRIPNTSKMGYLEFEMYTTDVTPEKIVLSIKTTDNSWITFTYNLDNAEKNTWNNFKIPLSEFVSSNANYTWRNALCIDVMKFMLPSYIISDSDIYFKNMRISYAPVLVTEAEETESAVNLSWTTDANGISGYNIYRNGTAIAKNVTVTSYLDTEVTENSIYTYKIEAISDGKTIVSREITVNYKLREQIIYQIVNSDGTLNEDIATKNSVTGVCSHKGSYDERLAVPSYGVEKESVKAVKYEITSAVANNLNAASNPTFRIKLNSGIKFPRKHISDGYIRLKIYAETDNKLNLPDKVGIHIKNSNSVWTSSNFIFDGEIKLNTWNEVKLLFKDFTGYQKQLYDEINNIAFCLPSNLTACNFYISDMAVCYGDNIEGKAYTEQKMLVSDEFESICDGVIMYHGAKHASVNGYRRELADGAYPYKLNFKIYVPLEFTLEALGIDVYISDAGAEFYYNGKNYAVADKTKISNECKNAAELKNGIIYVAAEDISAVTGISLYENNGLVIFSLKNEITTLDDNTAEQIRSALSYDWGRMHLTAEGFITGIIAHPLDGDIRYARTDVGGCYRWIPETGEWKQLMEFIPYEERNLMSVNGFAVDPNNKDIIYILCGGNSSKTPQQLLKSYDRGDTWINTYFDLPSHNGLTRSTGERVAVDPNNSDIVYVGTFNNGLWRSLDAGKTWNQIAKNIEYMENEGINAVVFDQTSGIQNTGSSLIYISAYGSGLYKSVDGGETFTKTDVNVTKIERMKMLGSNLFFTSQPYEDGIGGFFKYTSAGQLINLTPNDGTLTMGSGKDFIIDYTDSDFMIVASHNPPKYRWRTKDGGKTWEWFSSEDGVNNAAFLQDPSNPERLLDANGRGLWTYENIYTDDIKYNIQYGREQTNIEELVTLKVMSVPDENAPMLLVGAYDRGYLYCENKIDPAILQWYEYNKTNMWGIAVDMDYCERAPKYVMRVCRRQEVDYRADIVLSSDYGRAGVRSTSWDKESPAIAGAVSAGVQANGYPVALIATPKSDDGTPGSIYRTTDWGTTWQRVSGVEVKSNSNFYSNYREYVLISDSVDPDVFYFYEGNKFYISRDAGITWTANNYLEENFGITPSSPSMVARPDKTGEIWLTAGDSVYKTTDMGESWEKLEIAQSCKYMSFGKGKAYLDAPALYMFGTVGGVEGLYISDDLGSSWRRLDHNGMNILGEVCQIAGDMNKYGRVFVSTGGTGVMWFEESRYNDMENDIFAVKRSSVTRTESIQTCNIEDVIDVYAQNDSTQEYQIIVCAYGKANNLEDVFVFDKNDSKATFNVLSNYTKIKIMMWSYLTNIIPLTDITEIEVN